MSMGYVAVGRPSADFASDSLCDLVRGRDVILVGDRDPHGVGQRGLEAAFLSLKPVCRSVVKCLPPEGFKDLRQWHPTGEQFQSNLAVAGVTEDSNDVLGGSSPYDMIQEWLRTTQMKGGTRLFHNVHGDYFRWHSSQYDKVEQKQVRQEWYQFFAGREIKIQQANSVKIVAVKTDRHLMTDLDDAASALCYVQVEPDAHEPFLIKTGKSMDLTRAVVFQNGILHVTEDRLSALSPDIFLTSTLPYEYRPGYKCPLWLWFVANVFNGDLECVALLQEWFGYNLIASNHMQSMMFFFGVPGSGKSTTGNVLRAVLGNQRSCAAGTENFTALFGKESLLNKYAAIMSESRGVNKADIDKLLQTWKAITGGDAISVARKYKGAVDARLFCRLTYIANEAIPFDDASQAMANRMNLLYFPNNYRKNKPDWDLERKLKAEAPGIALWAIEGLKRLLSAGQFTHPKTSMDHLASLAELTNPIGTMVAECCQVHVGDEFLQYRTSCNDLYDLWKVWCDDNHVRTSMTSVGFGMKFKTMEYPVVRRQVMEAKNRSYVYQGLEILPSAYERYLKR
jgi:P4 family phage/plasmid primase-like protien